VEYVVSNVRELGVLVEEAGVDYFVIGETVSHFLASFRWVYKMTTREVYSCDLFTRHREPK
jgi:hypothetical protein